jgi:hypothetical protein
MLQGKLRIYVNDTVLLCWKLNRTSYESQKGLLWKYKMIFDHTDDQNESGLVWL